ncbi:MAG: GAF domain-containing SpoIIE family protein phosphatase [Bacillota bacterium]
MFTMKDHYGDLIEANRALTEKLDKTKEQHREILLFADFCSSLLKTTDIGKVSDIVVRQFGRLVDSERVSLVRKEAQQDLYEYRCKEGEIIKKKLLHRNQLEKKFFFMFCHKIHIGADDFPIIAVPIKYEGENLGVVIFEGFGQDDVEKDNTKLMELFALPAGLAIKNCLLQQQVIMEKEIISKQHRVMNEDLAFAQKIQECILASGYHDFGDYEFYADHMQTHYLGGDFYDVFKTDEDTVVFYIADISGHGVSSSMLTVFLKQAVRGIAQSFQGKKVLPSEILTKLQIRFDDLNMKEELYIGILIGTLDLQHHKIVLSNAGHNIEPILINKGLGMTSTCSVEGMPINNWFTDKQLLPYENQEVDLCKGEQLILLTDGAVEAINEHGTPIGMEAVKKMLINTRNLSLETQFQKLLQYINGYIGKKQLIDDIAFLGIRRKG